MWCWGLALSILVFLYLFINDKIGYQCVFLVNVDIPGQALLKIAYIKPFKYKHVLYTFRKDTYVIIAKRSVEMRQIRAQHCINQHPDNDLSILRPYMADNKIKHVSVYTCIHFNILSSNVDSNATVEEGYVLNQPTESHLRSPALKKSKQGTPVKEICVKQHTKNEHTDGV